MDEQHKRNHLQFGLLEHTCRVSLTATKSRIHSKHSGFSITPFDSPLPINLTSAHFHLKQNAHGLEDSIFSQIENRNCLILSMLDFNVKMFEIYYPTIYHTPIQSNLYSRFFALAYNSQSCVVYFRFFLFRSVTFFFNLH